MNHLRSIYGLTGGGSVNNEKIRGMGVKVKMFI